MYLQLAMRTQSVGGWGGRFISDGVFRFSWKLAGRLKRFPLTSSDLLDPAPSREEGEGALQRPITLFTIRTAIISRQQSEPAGFSIYYPRVYIYTRRCERKRGGGKPLSDKRRAQKTRTTPSWSSFAVVATLSGIWRWTFVSSLLNNTRVRTWKTRGDPGRGKSAYTDVIGYIDTLGICL